MEDSLHLDFSPLLYKLALNTFHPPNSLSTYLIWEYISCHVFVLGWLRGDLVSRDDAMDLTFHQNQES